MPDEQLPVLGVNPSELTPKEIVAELDRYIVGQQSAKKAVAIALRNRWRRRKLDPAMREDVAPKNILMIGPTGVGKTEIARRLAALSGAPFIKIEATRYTEIGYHGRDVESMIRDLVKASINMVQSRAREGVRAKAAEAAEERLLDVLLPAPSAYAPSVSSSSGMGFGSAGAPSGNSAQGAKDASGSAELHEKTREKLRQKLKDGALDGREVELEVAAPGEAVGGIFAPAMGEELGMELQDALSRMMPKKTKRRKMTVAEARRALEAEEAEKLIDQETVTRQALEVAENLGIVFIDEIDKVAGSGREQGPDVSREGVQRDLLPIVEGASVNTRWGIVKTDHMLFIAAGAFHTSKPSDLLPELQGRFPIRVELNDLTEDDFKRILTAPKNAIVKQYQALLATEGVTLDFTDDALAELASFAARANRVSQNIGARRLHTVIERLLEEVSFNAAEMKGKKVTVDAKMVKERLLPILEDEDLARYIL
ncbi:MAG: ATP-dependent protease ATPase subunit HslU [Planctomycetota bacterium]|nr:ATP-dependent protease ATPase subunit HslU [Planctomycetota bacterium]